MTATAIRHLVRLAPLAAIPALAGCGFTPLYATPGLAPALATMDVVAPQTRAGFLLREQIDDELGHKPGDAVRYQLTCTVSERRFPRGVRVNNVANRYEIDMTVAYALTEAGGEKVLLRGLAPVIVTYDSADAPYAGVAAEQDGENRAAGQAAVQIRLQLGRYFAGFSSHPAIVETPNNPLSDGSTPVGSSVSATPTVDDQPTADGPPAPDGSPAVIAPPPGDGPHR